MTDDRLDLDRRSALIEAVLLGAMALVVYWITGPSVHGDMWPPLAEAFLSGQLHLAEDRPWLELVPRAAGGQYVPLPPVPALTLIPAALFTGPDTPWGEAGRQHLREHRRRHQRGSGVLAAPRLGRGAGVSPVADGRLRAHHALVGGGNGRPPSLRGDLRGDVRPRVAEPGSPGEGPACGRPPARPGSRITPAGWPAFPAVAAIYARQAGWRIGLAQLRLAAGIAVPALFLAIYNVARFGSPIDFGYAHIPSGETGLITDEPWFSEGLMSVTYIPRHLKVMFYDGFQIVGDAPFLKPSFSGASLVLTAPFLFLSVLARGRIVPWLWLGVLLVMLPDLMWGSWGFAQFGYRRILDAMPLLLLLLGLAYRDRPDWILRVAVIFGIVVHAYGIYVINVLGFVA